MVDQIFLDRFNPLAIVLKDGKVIIHDGVNQRVGQIVRAHPAGAALAGPDALAHRIEDIPRLLLKGDDILRAHHHAELLRVEQVAHPAVVEHFQHDEEIVPVILQLRTLAGVGNVLEHQGVQVKMRPQLLDELHLVDAVDVDPAHPRQVPHKETVLDARHLLFHQTGFVIVHKGDQRLLLPLRPDVDERARRQSGFA